MLTLVVPMAGLGTRMKNYKKKPKVFINVEKKPMFIFSIENINVTFHNLILITQKKHNIKKKYGNYFKKKNYKTFIIEIDEILNGPLMSVLAAQKILKKFKYSEILIINSDQKILWAGDWVINWFRINSCEGGVPTINRKSTRHSYVKFDKKDPRRIVLVREKEKISNNATVGVYWFNTINNFLKASNKCISKKDFSLHNNEYYISHVYNYLEGKIFNFNLTEFWSLGEKRNLIAYLKSDYKMASKN
jgi:dTDP-glucose pyrophosphorylase